MDFVAREIFFLFLFSLTLGTFGKIAGKAPDNRAVVVGTPVKITCSSETDGNLIKWSLKAVGDTTDGDGKIIIKEGNGIIKDTDNYSGVADGASYNLTIIKASQSTAGIYFCAEDGPGGKPSKLSTLLIVLEEPTCDYIPRKTNTLPCNTTMQLSCTATYFINKDYVIPNLKWLRGKENEVVAGEDSTPSTSKTTTTTNSTLNVTWSSDGTMQSYTCETTFKLNKNLPSGTGSLSEYTPAFHHQCQPFASASSVTCGGTDDDPSTTTGADDIHQSKLSSPRSAETNNLAIRVLGVAGVLLLAQMF